MIREHSSKQRESFVHRDHYPTQDFSPRSHSSNSRVGRNDSRNLNYYMDLKEGDSIYLEQDELTVRVLHLRGNNLALEYDGKVRVLKKNQGAKVGDACLLNKGRRHASRGSHRGGYQGRRVHATLIIPDRDYKFVHYKDRLEDKT